MRVRIAFLVLAALLAAAAPREACAASAGGDDELLKGIEGPVAGFGLMYTGISAALTSHNIKNIRAGTPGKLGGAAGMIFGAGTAVYGVACMFFPEPVIFATGVCCTTAGVITAYYGVRTLKEVRQIYFEEHGQGLSVSPIIMEDGRGGACPGLQISLRF